MRYLCRRITWRNQRGSVAVEAALIITLILIPLLAFILFFGRYFWYYTVAQKAVHDATLILSGMHLTDIKNNSASAFVQGVVGHALSDLDQDTLSTNGVSLTCFYRVPANSQNLAIYPCTFNARPAAVRVAVAMIVEDPFLSPFTFPMIGADGINIFAGVTMNYRGI